jgi:exopolyphosphatase/pppGpp-phosphohydrolase
MSATAHARSAVIDVGSNTIHLLVGEVENGAVLPVTGEKVSARLGSGVDKTGKIEEARIPVAVEAIGRRSGREERPDAVRGRAREGGSRGAHDLR